MGKLKKYFCLLIAVLLLASVIPSVALADDPVASPTEAQSNEIYVSAPSENSQNNESVLTAKKGTRENPYETLADAAEAINKTKNQDYTIYIMSDLIMTKSARFWDNDVSIQSDPDAANAQIFRLYRAKNGFVAEQDPARGGYNPALIEIGGEGGNGGDLTLSNIILDDGHYAAYSVNSETVSGQTPYFVQVDASRSSDSTDTDGPGYTKVDGENIHNHKIVQDAMIASYDSNSTITLGAGTTLQNYGGMSAVRVTGSSKLVMEPESKICDAGPTYIRSKGAAGSNGPAGAVWIQSGNFKMKDGAEISNLNGRAIYVDGGIATVGGTISDITANKNAMWEHEDGTVLHLRNKATATLTESGKAVNCTDGNMVIVNEATFTMEAGSLLGNSNAAGIKTNEDAPSGAPSYDKNRNTVTVNGKITGIQGNKNPIQFKYGTLIIGEYGEICGNTGSYGAIYLQRDADVHIYGKIYDNTVSDKGGGIGLPGHGHIDIIMYDGAEIHNNKSKNGGGGLCLADCTFTMEGGRIYNNSTDADGGGVLVRKGSAFIMKGGSITGNECQGVGGGVAYDSADPSTKVQLIGGEVSNNKMYKNLSNEIENDIAVIYGTTGISSMLGYMTIDPLMTIDNEKIFFEKYNFSIERPGKGVKFGNAATDCETEVTTALSSKNLTQVVGSIWYQTNKGNLPLTVYDLTENGKYNKSKDLYAAVVNTKEDGTPVENATVSLYAVNVKSDDSFEVNLPGGAAYGTAVVFLQEGNTPANIITLKPVDLTAYMGGDGGYDQVVIPRDSDESGSKSLPHPLFQLIGTDGTPMKNVEGTFATSGKTWTLVEDGAGYYHFKEGADQENVRVTYTNDKTGENTLSDAFELQDVHDTFNTYTVALYTGAVDMSQVTATLNGTNYAVALGTGKLTVRAVADTEPGDDPTIDVINESALEKVESGTAVAVAPTGTTYTLNNTEVPLPEIASDTNPNGSKPSLLFDSIIEDDDHPNARTDALKKQVDKTLGAVGSNTTRHYEVKYLDLVDANNGNAWITSSAGMDIYWGYPEGTDINTKFHVLHFEGLHRDGEASGFEISDIESANVIELTEETDQLQNTKYGIKFHVKPGDFSPYVLVWEKTSTSHNPGIIPTPDPDPTPEPEEPDQPELERDDHYAYIFGYEDNTIRPENDITRAEVATIFYRLLTDESREAYRTTDHDFTDVSADAWHVEPVATLAGAGLLAGYEDGSFRPDAPITRAEYAAIATRFDELAAAESNFTDISGHWAEDAINAAYGAGWVGGYEDGTFRPDQNITRAEAMALINRVLERAVDSDGMLDEMTHWADNDPAAWYYADIQEATHSHTYEREEGEQYETWTDLVPHKVF